MTKNPFMIWIRGEASEAKNHAILQIPETIHRWRVLTDSSWFFRAKHLSFIDAIYTLDPFMFLMFIQFDSENTQLIDFLKRLYSDVV